MANQEDPFERIQEQIRIAKAELEDLQEELAHMSTRVYCEGEDDDGEKCGWEGLLGHTEDNEHCPKCGELLLEWETDNLVGSGGPDPDQLAEARQMGLTL